MAKNEIEKRLDRIEAQIKKHGARFDIVDSRFDRLEVKIDGLAGDVKSLTHNVGSLTGDVKSLTHLVKKGFEQNSQEHKKIREKINLSYFSSEQADDLLERIDHMEKQIAEFVG